VPGLVSFDGRYLRLFPLPGEVAAISRFLVQAGSASVDRNRINHNHWPSLHRQTLRVLSLVRAKPLIRVRLH